MQPILLGFLFLVVVGEYARFMGFHPRYKRLVLNRHWALLSAWCSLVIAGCFFVLGLFIAVKQENIFLAIIPAIGAIIFYIQFQRDMRTVFFHMFPILYLEDTEIEETLNSEI